MFVVLFWVSTVLKAGTVPVPVPGILNLNRPKGLIVKIDVGRGFSRPFDTSYTPVLLAYVYFPNMYASKVA